MEANPAFCTNAEPKSAHLAPKAPVTPPIKRRKRKLDRLILALDLDECLVHSTYQGTLDDGPVVNKHRIVKQQTPEYRQEEYRPTRTGPYADSFQVTTEVGDVFWVNRRPGLDAFLEIARENFDIFIYSAAQETYVKPVVQHLDPSGKIFRGILCRQHCQATSQGSFLKNLSILSNDLSRIVLVDNNPASVILQPRNAIPVSSFFDDPTDRDLHMVLDVLLRIKDEADVTRVLHEMFQLEIRLARYRELMLNQPNDTRRRSNILRRIVHKVQRLTSFHILSNRPSLVAQPA